MDASRIGQVVTNYLTNALKYSAAEQEVVVRVEATSTEARVLVLDHGAVLTEGEPQSITRDPRVIEAYLGTKWSAHA